MPIQPILLPDREAETAEESQDLKHDIGFRGVEGLCQEGEAFCLFEELFDAHNVVADNLEALDGFILHIVPLTVIIATAIKKELSGMAYLEVKEIKSMGIRGAVKTIFNYKGLKTIKYTKWRQ